MRLVSLLILSAATLFCQQPNTLTPKEAADGWILLFDGESLFGWTQEMAAKWRVADGAIIADAGDYGWVRTNSVFADYVLRCDFKTTADGNSGLFLRSSKEGKPHETGYELQIFDTHPKFPTGSLVMHVPATGGKIKPNQWQTFEVTVQGDRFIVKLDGKQVLDARDPKSKIGHIGLQYNKDKKIEFRNIKLKPLGLQSMFDGKSLTGWTQVKAPKPNEDPIWTARNNMIHVEKGPGELQSDKQFDNFVFQIDIRANTKDPKLHPNSGVFFRGLKGEHWTGYESQIRNEFKDGDPTKPVDTGTGGIYFYQPARKVVGKDNEFFTKTIVAHGRHIATWINGYPVADWEDPHPEGPRVRDKQANLKPGHIGLQAHDPTTNLDFKNIKIAPLP
jgi:hypothetical protein